MALAEAGLAEMRALIFELRPESLAAEGLIAALTKQVDVLRTRYKLSVDAQLGEEPPLSLEDKQALYRIAQEALHNIVKHAHARTVLLRLSRQDGELIYTGWSRGSEGFGDSPIQSWRQYVTDPPEPMRGGFFRYFLFHDPNWDYHTIDWDRDLAYAEQKLPFMAAVDRDLSPFKRHGGKLLMYTGWADPVVPPQDTVAYYEAVAKTMGGPDKTRDFYRFFLAPGMGHCSGGPGPNQFDILTALEQWVEKSIAPDRIVATHSTNGKIDRTRPLCMYPQVARWKGPGNTDDAVSFACVSEPGAGGTRRTTNGSTRHN